MYPFLTCQPRNLEPGAIKIPVFYMYKIWSEFMTMVLPGITLTTNISIAVHLKTQNVRDFGHFFENGGCRQLSMVLPAVMESPAMGGGGHQWLTMAHQSVGTIYINIKTIYNEWPPFWSRIQPAKLSKPANPSDFMPYGISCELNRLCPTGQCAHQSRLRLKKFVRNPSCSQLLLTVAKHNFFKRRPYKSNITIINFTSPPLKCYVPCLLV